MESASICDYNNTETTLVSEAPSPPPPPPRVIDYKEELITYFFNNMLDVIVDSWEGLAVVESVDSIPSGPNICDTREYMFSAEVDEAETVEPECELEQQSFSFNRSSADIDNYRKLRNSDQKKPRKSKSKKSKSNLKRSSNKSSTNQEDVLKALETVNDTAWIIEPVKENVVIKFKNGNMYEGSVFGKLMHGFGKFTWHTGEVYTGDFSNGEITGSGTLNLKDTSYYEGSFLRGYRHGEGHMSVSKSLSAYRGGWRAGLKHGRGWQHFHNQNDWYDGQWENDLMEGSGIRQYPSGARYQGKFHESKRDGRGFAIMRNSDYYSGGWSSGKRKGFGEYIWNTFYNKLLCVPIQTSYIGSWDKNNRDGLGLINFGLEGGARYAGYFENNLKHGSGVLICENGTTYESRQLFSKDKPIHIKPNGSYFTLESFTTSEETSSSSEYLDDDDKSSVSSLVERQQSSYKLISKQILFTNFNMSMDIQRKATTNVCKLAFPIFQENYASMCIPINSPSEMIILTHYLKKVVDYYPLQTSQEQLSIYGELKDKLKRHCCHSSPSKQSSPVRSLGEEGSFNLVNKDQIEYEEKNLRKAITMHLPRVRAIYKQYTTVACVKDVPFPTLLTRLFLWQLYRDCKIPEKGLSLRKIDELMAGNPDTELESQHNPFETIYFWQFLHSIIVVSISLYAKECAIYAQGDGILKSAFLKLLEEDIYPNCGHHIGCMLFDYVDVLSLKSAYKWFLQIKDPCTVYKFLLLSCTIKKCEPSYYYRKKIQLENIPLRMGINAYAFGHSMTYLYDELPSIRTEPVLEELKMTDQEPFKDLYFLRYLGAKTVLSILAKLCPFVKNGKDIVNMNYQMTFYEFYEAVLLCTQEHINREKEAKLKAKLEENKSFSENFVISKMRKRSKRITTKKKITVITI